MNTTIHPINCAYKDWSVLIVLIPIFRPNNLMEKSRTWGAIRYTSLANGCSRLTHIFVLERPNFASVIPGPFTSSFVAHFECTFLSPFRREAFQPMNRHEISIHASAWHELEPPGFQLSGGPPRSTHRQPVQIRNKIGIAPGLFHAEPFPADDEPRLQPTSFSPLNSISSSVRITNIVVWLSYPWNLCVDCCSAMVEIVGEDDWAIANVFAMVKWRTPLNLRVRGGGPWRHEYLLWCHNFCDTLSQIFCDTSVTKFCDTFLWHSVTKFCDTFLWHFFVTLFCDTFLWHSVTKFCDILSQNLWRHKFCDSRFVTSQKFWQELANFGEGGSARKFGWTRARISSFWENSGSSWSVVIYVTLLG